MTAANQTPASSVGAREIRCSANRGKQYAVNLNAKGEATHVKVKCYTDAGHYWRMVWNLSHETMSTTAACAIRAALAKASVPSSSGSAER